MMGLCERIMRQSHFQRQIPENEPVYISICIYYTVKDNYLYTCITEHCPARRSRLTATACGFTFALIFISYAFS